MPAAFDKCVREGGRIRTKSLPGDEFIRICIDKDGKSHPGEVKTKKASSHPDKKKKLSTITLFSEIKMAEHLTEES